MISCANPKAQYLPYKDEITEAIQKVLDSGNYILGEQVSLFEKEFAEYLGADFAIGCGSGTDALVLALKALDIGSGDEVIVPSFTATPTVAAVVMAGATPVYVDIEPDFFTLDPVRVKEACTDKTKAVIAVHLYGQAAAMDELMLIAKRYDLRVIEDCAQAAGASYNGVKLGTIGDVGCFSFFPTKNLGAIGDAGAVVCNGKEFAARIRGLRQYGWDKNRVSQEAGVNSRLDEIQAAILRVKFKYLDSDNKWRTVQAKRYDHGLDKTNVICPQVRKLSAHVYHLYVLQVERRDFLLQSLKERGIITSIHYPSPVHHMPAFRSDVYLPVTESLMSSIISLPLYPGLHENEQMKVIQTVRSFYEQESD